MLGKRPRLLQRSSSRMKLPEGLGHEVERQGSGKLCGADAINPRVPSQVIGFNLVNRDSDGVASPGVGNACSQVKWPGSAVTSMFSKSKKGCEAVGLGIVVALSTSDQQADVLKKKASVYHMSQPIPIAPFQSGMKDLKPTHGSAPSEMEFRGSIFSTASPSSTYNDGYGHMPLTDFLSACFFCKRKLAPGKDIYMYRGDRAFCTIECRYQQIVIDEGKEKCSAAAMKSGATALPSAKPRHGSTGLRTTTATAA